MGDMLTAHFGKAHQRRADEKSHKAVVKENERIDKGDYWGGNKKRKEQYMLSLQGKSDAQNRARERKLSAKSKALRA